MGGLVRAWVCLSLVTTAPSHVGAIVAMNFTLRSKPRPGQPEKVAVTLVPLLLLPFTLPVAVPQPV